MQCWYHERGYEGTREEGMCLGGECEVVAAEARVPNGAVAATPGRAAWSGCRENTKYLLLHVL